MGSTTLADGTLVEYLDFLPDFFLNGDKPDTRSGDYNNPAAVLGVTPPNGQRIRVFAMGEGALKGAPMLSAAKAGYKWKLAAFEKTPVRTRAVYQVRSLQRRIDSMVLRRFRLDRRAGVRFLLLT
jgi:hypothetical protein